MQLCKHCLRAFPRTSFPERSCFSLAPSSFDPCCCCTLCHHQVLHHLWPVQWICHLHPPHGPKPHIKWCMIHTQSRCRPQPTRHNLPNQYRKIQTLSELLTPTPLSSAKCQNA